MAVSKRLRYEILRRDNFTCRYCMTATPGTPLRVDHVVPVALGGTDDPTNLVTSCEPCNSGKTSTVPDSPLVAQVREDAMRWQMAWAVAVGEAETEGKQRAKDIAKVKKNYVAAYKGRHGQAPILPEGWEASVGRWLDLGLPLTLIDKAIASAVGRDKIPAKDRFAYFAGCCWSLLKELRDRTEQIANEASPTNEAIEGYDEEEEVDERSFGDRIEEAFALGWSEAEQPDAECLRMLLTYARAASAAGYDHDSIGYAAYRAAQNGHGDLRKHLQTVDKVLARWFEPDFETPFGKATTNNDLLPSSTNLVARAVAEAAVAVWLDNWRGDARERPSHYSNEVGEFYDEAVDAYCKRMDAADVIRGAQWAGCEDSTNLSQAIDEAVTYYAIEPAVSAWEYSYYTATGSYLPESVHEGMWADCRNLRANRVWDHQIIAAAAFAGAHATTRMHFGLGADNADLIGVAAPNQKIEDCWARSWYETWHSWPSEEEREALRANLSSIAKGEAHKVGDVTTAAIAAGAYRSTELYPNLTRSLSVFEAAARLPHLEGE